jgi:YVTN family beta-propeller protein
MKTILLPILTLLAITTIARADGPYHLLKEISVGGDTGWDDLTVDSAAHRLYVSHGTKVVVIDLATDTVAGEVTNTPGVHAIAAAPNLNRGFTSNGRENMVGIFDLKTLQTLSKVGTQTNPDAILFDSGQNEVYAFNGRSQSATVIDAKSGTVTATIPLGGKPEFARSDPGAGLVFDNLEDKNEVVAIDTKTHMVTKRWPIAPGEAASGLALDEKNHRLFLGCDNHLMLMMDSTGGKVLASVPIGEGVDGAAFDPATQLAFASCGDGTTTIAKEDDDKLKVVQTLQTAKFARTMTIDPATHRIYLPTAQFEAPAEGQRRGKMVPGSFKILVYGMEK